MKCGGSYRASEVCEMRALVCRPGKALALLTSLLRNYPAFDYSALSPFLL